VKRARLLAIVCVVSCVAGSPAGASGKKDQAALAQLDAAYQATGKLPAGADRTRQACADAVKLQSAAAAIPEKHAPVGAAVDDPTWYLTASQLGSKIEDLVAVCKAPDHKLTHIGNRVETADEIVAAIDGYMRAVLDASRPRDLPPAMKTFQATLKGMRAASKQVCAQHGKLTKLLPDLATPPARADAAKWQQVHARVKASLDELEQFACGKPRGADEEIAGSLNLVHDGYYQLVLLVPPHA
jgi:hypothetical protein